MVVAPLILSLVAQAGALPPDRAAMIASARAATERHDDAGAITTLEAARAANPEDPEILRLLGSAYARKSRYGDAISTLKQAEALAPNDLDIKAALARAYLWLGDRSAARREVEAIDLRDRGNEDARQITVQLDAAGRSPANRRFGVAVGQSESRVDFDAGPSRTWSTTTVAAFGQVAPQTTVTVQAEREDRQTAIDTRLEARIDQQFGGGISGHLAVAGTPHADFREKLSVAGGVEAAVTSRLTLLADVRQAEYGRGVNVTAVEPGARLAIPVAGLSVTARMINLWDERGTHRSGASGRVDKEFAGGATLYAGAATYPDTEAGITRQVHAAFVGGALPLSEAVTLRAGLDYERRHLSYTQKGASLGLQFRF